MINLGVCGAWSTVIYSLVGYFDTAAHPRVTMQVTALAQKQTQPREMRGCGRLVSLSGSLVVNVTLKAAGGASDLLDQDTLLDSAADFRHGLAVGLLAHFAHEVFNYNVDKERSTRESSMLPQPKMTAYESWLLVLPSGNLTWL